MGATWSALIWRGRGIVILYIYTVFWVKVMRLTSGPVLGGLVGPCKPPAGLLWYDRFMRKHWENGMRKAVVSTWLIMAGLLAVCGEQEASASNQASEAEIHAITAKLATMVANENANACFQQNRLALRGYESKLAGVRLNQLLATLPADVDAENVDLIKLGYKINGPTDDVLNDLFMQCLKSGSEEH